MYIVGHNLHDFEASACIVALLLHAAATATHAARLRNEDTAGGADGGAAAWCTTVSRIPTSGSSPSVVEGLQGASRRFAELKPTTCKTASPETCHTQT